MAPYLRVRELTFIKAVQPCVYVKVSRYNPNSFLFYLVMHRVVTLYPFLIVGVNGVKIVHIVLKARFLA